MWINAIAGVVTELDRSGRMAGFGGWSWGGVALAEFGVGWPQYVAAAVSRIHRASPTHRQHRQFGEGLNCGVTILRDLRSACSIATIGNQGPTDSYVTSIRAK